MEVLHVYNNGFKMLKDKNRFVLIDSDTEKVMEYPSYIKESDIIVIGELTHKAVEKYYHMGKLNGKEDYINSVRSIVNDVFK